MRFSLFKTRSLGVIVMRSLGVIGRCRAFMASASILELEVYKGYGRKWSGRDCKYYSRGPGRKFEWI